jgi:ribulose-phosphate 3-epimerase
MMKDLLAFSYPAVSPSLLAANPKAIPAEIEKAQAAGAPFIHIDCMDGKFVPNLAFDESFVRHYHTEAMVNDVHIMIEKPWLFVQAYGEAGADILTFHLEACPDKESVLTTIEEIRSVGLHPGLSIKPGTPALKVLPYLDLVDLVLVMSVEPGKGGQSFLPSSLNKLFLLKKEILKREAGKRPLLEVDGGINDLTGPECVKQGADVLVAGSYLYGHEDFASRLKKLVL